MIPRPPLALLACASLLLAGAAGCKARAGGRPDGGAPGDGGNDGGSPPARCEQWGAPALLGTLDVSAGLAELSGLAVSATDPDLLWVHNDSGDAAQLYALSRSGALRATFLLEGVVATDWEDLARGPCPPGLPAGDCLFVGDIGDNLAARASLELHVLPEPVVTAGGDPRSPRPLTATSLTLSYGDGARDAEALFVEGGRPFLVTKGREGPPAVYAVEGELLDGASRTLRRLFTFADDDLEPASPWVTAADLHAASSRLLLRGYDSLHELDLGGALSAATLGSAAIRPVPAATEPQGEAVAWEPGGEGYLTLSEQVGELHRVACAD
ncbi:MAG: hypothetical protein P1V51_18940 [Deltaproteobacteria bacterium]|nr:hypothetical protein [Deltaproteobacteria bacterium]